MIGVIRQTIKAVPLRLQNPKPKLFQSIYYKLGDVHPTQHDESDELEKEKIKYISYHKYGRY